MPTPPPPMWGEILEEQNYDPRTAFYDHEKSMAAMKLRKTQEMKKRSFEYGEEKPMSKRLKLKKKVIYTYEYEDASDHGEDRKQS